MDSETYWNLRLVTKSEDLPQTAQYYTVNSIYKPSLNIMWYDLYDEEFNLVEQVRVHFTNSIKNLIRIIENEKIDNLFDAMYKTKKINDNYSYVIEDEKTAERLKTISNSLK